MEIKSLSKLNSNEKTSIEQLVFICNTFDKSKNILFLSNEFNAILVDTEYLMEYDKFNNLLSSKKVSEIVVSVNTFSLIPSSISISWRNEMVL